jgi:hypothetical protein
MSIYFNTQVTIVNPTNSLVNKFKELEGMQEPDLVGLSEGDIDTNFSVNYGVPYIIHADYAPGSIIFKFGGLRDYDTESVASLYKIIDSIQPTLGRYEVIKIIDDSGDYPIVTLRVGNENGGFDIIKMDIEEPTESKYWRESLSLMGRSDNDIWNYVRSYS